MKLIALIAILLSTLAATACEVSINGKAYDCQMTDSGTPACSPIEYVAMP